MHLAVERLSVGPTPPVFTWHGPRRAGRPTLRLEGSVVEGPGAGLDLVVPVGEVLWQGLAL